MFNFTKDNSVDAIMDSFRKVVTQLTELSKAKEEEVAILDSRIVDLEAQKNSAAHEGNRASETAAKISNLFS